MEAESITELVPLSIAAKRIFSVVYAKDVLSPERATGLAYAISVLVPVYVHETADRKLRRISPSEFADGVLRDGGDTLAFIDGRTSLLGLAVSELSVEHVVTFLRPHMAPSTALQNKMDEVRLRMERSNKIISDDRTEH